MKTVMQKILIALIGIATISSCSAQEKRPATGTAANETVVVQEAQYQPPAEGFDLWNGFMTNMTIEQVIARANEILQPSSTDISNGVSFIDSFDKYLFGASLGEYYPSAKRPHQSGSKALQVASKDSAYIDVGYNIQFLFYHGELICVKVLWKMNASDLLARLKQEFGYPVRDNDKVQLKDNMSIFRYTDVWRTPEKLILYTYDRSYLTDKISTAPFQSVLFAHRIALEDYAAAIIEAKKQEDDSKRKAANEGVKF